MPIFQDVKIALRRLAARPACTLLILGTLALGIGAATAVFSVVDQTVLRPAPFPYADRLVDVMHIHSVRKSGGSSMTPQKTLGWQGRPSLFERLEMYAPQQMDVTDGTEPERLSGLNVSLGLFDMLAACSPWDPRRVSQPGSAAVDRRDHIRPSGDRGPWNHRQQDGHHPIGTVAATYLP